jgi:CubicO group peptidase (beta-lactamase class C family)
MNMKEIIESCNKDNGRFNGAILMKSEDKVLVEQGYGYANRSEKLGNTTSTRFGIASGAKIFTAVAILQLVEKGLLELETPLGDCIDETVPPFHSGITVRHLLTHSSGIPDYFDEETMTEINAYEELWTNLPMYTITSLQSFLPLFENKRMKFSPGERFSYSNSGYILLGLIVEQITGLRFQEYVELNIFNICGMHDSGYYRLDQLPARTAVGYIEEGDTWRSNIYSVPVIGGPDGGVFTTVYDLEKFWSALMNHLLLSKSLTDIMLFPHQKENNYIYYGLGVWILIFHNEVFKYFVMGSDPGVEMQSSLYPKRNAQAHVLSNNGKGAGAIARKFDEMLFHEGEVASDSKGE